MESRRSGDTSGAVFLSEEASSDRQPARQERCTLALYIFARFEPRPGKTDELREELHRVIEPTRAEPGCVRIQLFETIREPAAFFIHSEWVDEAAFEAHAEMPHVRRFVGAVEELIAHPLEAVRTQRIG